VEDLNILQDIAGIEEESMREGGLNIGTI